MLSREQNTPSFWIMDKDKGKETGNSFKGGGKILHSRVAVDTVRVQKACSRIARSEMEIWAGLKL